MAKKEQKQDVIPNKAVIKLAKSYGFDGAEFLFYWNGYKVFNPICDNDEVKLIDKLIFIIQNEIKTRIVENSEDVKIFEKYLRNRESTPIFYKLNPKDTIFWVDNGRIGEHIFTFDKKQFFNLFADYPWKLSPQEKKIFDKENPEWADFFKDRK